MFGSELDREDPVPLPMLNHNINTGTIIELRGGEYVTQCYLFLLNVVSVLKNSEIYLLLRHRV